LENQNKQKKELFDAALAAGDQLFASEKYAEAKAKYQEALALDAASTVAKTKISDVDAKLAANAAAQQKIVQFNALIKAGDDLAASGKFAEAKAKYQEAGKLDGSSPIPPQKIQQMDTELANQADVAKKKEQKDKYDAAMKAAEDLYKAGKLPEAKSKFSEASTIDASQTAPAQRIQQIDAELANIASANQKKAQIAALMKEGNDLMAKSDYENAKTKYNAVLSLDPANAEAPVKIQEANKKLAEMQNAEQKEAQFKALKAQGFEQFTQEKYNESKQTLLQAKELKADADVDKKLAEIEAKLKEIQANASADQVYQTLMQEGQALETAENYYAAVVKYQEASAKKPNEQLPKTKIEALNKLIEEHKKNKAAQAEIDAKYTAEMKRGNDLLARNNFLEAIQAFNAAGALKPNEKEPGEKAALAEQLARDEKDGAEKAYKNILDAGQAAIDRKDWAKATDMYNRAIDLKKDQTEFPKSKLAEVERLKQEEENAKKGQAELEKNYAAKLALGETEAKAKKYDEAISAYEAASAIKPNEQLPKTKIEELRELKRKDQNASQEKALYTAAMERGNEALNAKKYELALSEYKNALVVIPNDKTASSKVSEVQQILDNQANASAKQKLQDEYKQLIQEADQLFSQQKWESAEGRYEAALSRINNDSYAKKQIDKCKANQKANLAVEEAYKKKIAEADASYNSSDFKGAKNLYLEALDIKKGDSYVQQRLDEIETLLNPVVTQTGPLPNLGIPTTNSIIDGEAALIQAEQKRKSTKASKVKKKGDKIDDKNKVLDADKTNQLLYTSNEISEVEKKRSEKAVTDDESRQETVETVKENQVFISDEEKKASDFKYGENLNATQYTSDVRTEVNTDFEKSILVYEDNTDAVKTYNTRITDEIAKDSKTRYEEKLENQGQLTAISVKVDEKVIDDYESRKITETDVLQTQVKVVETNLDNEAKSTKNFNEIETSLDKTNKTVTVKLEEDSKVSNANSEEVKAVQVNTEENFKSIDEKKSADLLDSDLALSSKKTGVIEAVSTSDENRQEAVELLKEGDKSIYVAENQNFNNAVVKALTNQDEIAVQKQVNSGVSELEEATKANNITGIKNVDQKVLVVSKDNEMTDEQKRLKQRYEVEGIAQNVDKATESTKGKPSENEAGLKNVNKDVNTQGEVADKKLQDKTLESRKLIELYGKNEIKFDEKVANALGAQYPEGVSQESFVVNDEDGLLKAMVTRRIVVANGYGQIYVRTQTLTSTTYSKNGQPSSEYVWQKETGDAKLVKNY
jgi:tetratricopeptide (TPR) repeat protein